MVGQPAWTSRDFVALRQRGPVVKFVARGYHLYALPSAAKVRVASDWLFDSLLPSRVVQLDTVAVQDARIATAQSTQIYSGDIGQGVGENVTR